MFDSLRRIWVLPLLAMWLASGVRSDAQTVSLLSSPNPGPPVRHGLSKLEEAVTAKGWQLDRPESIGQSRGDFIIFAALPDALQTFQQVTALEKSLDVPEAVAIKWFTTDDKPTLLAAGSDERGLMYALLEVADSIAAASNVEELRTDIREIEETPKARDRALSVYTMHRATWERRFYDEDYWRRYFDTLAKNRFNRFLIIFGYENGGFLAPPYPYLFSTPGFPEVRMADLTEGQRRANLVALNRLIEIAHQRGISVTLGIWDHIYRGGVQQGGANWTDTSSDSPIPSSVVGVTSDNINDYTIASVKELLARVPEVDGLHFRVHEESGLSTNGMEGFWRTIFETARTARPDLFLELRGKNTPDAVISSATALGIDLHVETKFWMEQMGLPFHPMHTNYQDQRNRRHGYADFLRYPQRYHMTWRIWNAGTTRVLLWGDPEYVRRFVTSISIYDSPNFDVQEMLATKMVAQRPDAKPFDLMPTQYRYYDYEFERYWHFFQVWGRVGYNPDTPDEVWNREFRRRFGDAAPHIVEGLHHASQVLPRIVASVYPYSLFPTTRGWAERQALGASLADYAQNEGSDVGLFEDFDAAARRILSDGVTPKVTPETTSRWFDETADRVLANVREAKANIGNKRGKEFDSTITDLTILAHLARFHARRSLAAVHYNLYRRSQKPEELVAAARGEEMAIDAWRDLVNTAGNRYSDDLAMGPKSFNLGGHWRDELKILETNLSKLQAQAASVDAVPQAVAWSPRTTGDVTPPAVEHDPVSSARLLSPLRIVARVTDPSGVQSLKLRYRHVTQYEEYRELDFHPTERTNEYAATIPGGFLVPQWDVMYFIEVIDGVGNGAIWPDFQNRAPYVIVELER